MLDRLTGGMVVALAFAIALPALASVASDVAPALISALVVLLFARLLLP